MASMTRENAINLRTTGYITCILLLLFYTASILFSSLQNAKQEQVDLNAAFKNVKSSGLWGVSVALTSNIGTRLKERQSLPANIYEGTLDVGTSIGDGNGINKEIIRKNMSFVKDYLNILKTNVLDLLDTSSDRKATLENFIAQLELRYKDASLNLKEFSTQLQNLQNDMTSVNEKIASLKTKIDVDFKAFDATSTNENIEEYFSLRKQYTYDRTYIIFINQFVRQYNFLNEYNKKLLDTLINNKWALASSSFVVIPDSGWDLLKKLNLIYDEAEYKAQKTDTIEE